MSEVALYPWYLKSTIYVLKGFDQNWFEGSAEGLMPKRINDPIFCLTDKHEWDLFCELPYPISSNEVKLQLDKHRPLKTSTSSIPFLHDDGVWQGQADFQLIVKESRVATRFIEGEMEYWQRLPDVLVKDWGQENFVKALSYRDTIPPNSVMFEIAFSLWKLGNAIPESWKIDQSLFDEERDAVPIMDVFSEEERALRYD